MYEGLALLLYVYCRSSCGHCLGKADEDGSVERFMWMEKVPQTLAKTGTKSILGMRVINNSVEPLLLNFILHWFFYLLSPEVTSVLPSSPSGRRRGSKINTEEGKFEYFTHLLC